MGELWAFHIKEEEEEEEEAEEREAMGMGGGREEEEEREREVSYWGCLQNPFAEEEEEEWVLIFLGFSLDLF